MCPFLQKKKEEFIFFCVCSVGMGVRVWVAQHFKKKMIPVLKEEEVVQSKNSKKKKKKKKIWRGAKLMNTDRVYGLVVFTGKHTKIQLNSSAGFFDFTRMFFGFFR